MSAQTTILNYTRKTPSPGDIDRLDNGSACTMLGYQKEELELYLAELKEQGYLKDGATVYETISDTLNVICWARIQPGLNVFMISLDDMENINRFATSLRFERGYRWLDDIIDNNSSRVQDGQEGDEE